MRTKFQDLALACFKPSLPEESVPQVLEDLRSIIDQYAGWGRKRIVIDPIRRIDETEEEHEKRCVENALAPRKRGRPGYIPQRMLLYRVRELLQRNNCNYGLYFDGDDCPLLNLLELIHGAAGSPRGDVSWMSIAKKWGSPLEEFKLLLGSGMNISSASKAQAKRALRDAMREFHRNRG